MIFPVGLFLSVILVFCVSSHKFGSILYAMRINMNTFLLFSLCYIILMLFDLNIPFAEGRIVLNLAFLLTLVPVLKYYELKADWRIIFSCVFICGVYIFINFSSYISNYIVIMLSSYILPVLTAFLLLFTEKSFKKGIAAIALGYFASEIIMLLFHNAADMSIGNVSGQNTFLLMMTVYFFLFWTKCRFFGLPQNDIY